MKDEERRNSLGITDRAARSNFFFETDMQKVWEHLNRPNAFKSGITSSLPTQIYVAVTRIQHLTYVHVLKDI